MKKKVLILIESLGGGGAEKVLSTLVQHIDKSLFDVTVCVISGGGKYDDIVASNVKLTSILKVPEHYKGFKKVWYILKYQLIYRILPAWLVYIFFVPKEFDIEVAFVEGFVTKLLASSLNKKSKKISWVHVDLKERPWTLNEKVFRNLEDEIKAYKKYDTVICVSKSVENIMQSYYGLSNTKTIYNPLDDKEILKLGEKLSYFPIDKNKYNIVSVGRLHSQKGFDLLLPIIKRIIEKHRNIHLWIIGEGDQKEPLISQSIELGITKSVTFTGFLKNPYELMSKMDLFVCSSRAEGFSLVIAESMILGVPVISMNCSGPNELIGNNKYGKLCNSYEQFEMEIVKAIEGVKIPCQVPPLVDLRHTMAQIHQILN